MSPYARRSCFSPDITPETSPSPASRPPSILRRTSSGSSAPSMPRRSASRVYFSPHHTLHPSSTSQPDQFDIDMASSGGEEDGDETANGASFPCTPRQLREDPGVRIRGDRYDSHWDSEDVEEGGQPGFSLPSPIIHKIYLIAKEELEERFAAEQEDLFRIARQKFEETKRQLCDLDLNRSNLANASADSSDFGRTPNERLPYSLSPTQPSTAINLDVGAQEAEDDEGSHQSRFLFDIGMEGEFDVGASPPRVQYLLPTSTLCETPSRSRSLPRSDSFGHSPFPLVRRVSRPSSVTARSSPHLGSPSLTVSSNLTLSPDSVFKVSTPSSSVRETVGNGDPVSRLHSRDTVPPLVGGHGQRSSKRCGSPIEDGYFPSSQLSSQDTILLTPTSQPRTPGVWSREDLDEDVKRGNKVLDKLMSPVQAMSSPALMIDLRSGPARPITFDSTPDSPSRRKERPSIFSSPFAVGRQTDFEAANSPGRSQGTDILGPGYTHDGHEHCQGHHTQTIGDDLFIDDHMTQTSCLILDELEDTNTGPELPPIMMAISTEGGKHKAADRLYHLCRRCPNIRGGSFMLNVPKKHVKEKIGVAREKELQESEHFRKRICQLGDDVRRNVIAHAVHTTNLASLDLDVSEQSYRSLQIELQQCASLGIPTLVCHLGACPGQPKSDVLARTANILQRLLDSVSGVDLAIENMTHRRNGESSGSLSDIQSVIEQVNRPGRLKVCLDLCHAYVQEFDFFQSQGVREFFEAVDRLGPGNIAAMHVSDSYVEHGQAGDRHANLGLGMIPLGAFRTILRDVRFRDIPFLLETPAYFPRNRDQGVGIPKKIAKIEYERRSGELEFLLAICRLKDDEWEVEKESEALLNGWKRRKNKIESRIRKVLYGNEGALPPVFRETRKRIHGLLHSASANRRRRGGFKPSKRRRKAQEFGPSLYSGVEMRLTRSVAACG